MKKTILIISLIAVFCAFNIATDALADPDPYALGQETYLLQKTPVEGAPWTMILPDSDKGNIAFGKLEYFNYGEEFSFDFKGYDFYRDELDPGDTLMPADGSYALIYYADPGPGPWSPGEPTVYVLGISTGPYVPTSKGKAKGLEGVDIKICGSCDIGQIPYDTDDVNYPNGGKIWLVPLDSLELQTACTQTTMVTWPGESILFETSLITYGFEPAL